MKKKIALLLAFAMTLSMITNAFADDTSSGSSLSTSEAGLVSTNSDKATSPGYTYTGTGSIEYVDLEVFSIVVPTDRMFDFVMDPLGLLDVTTEGVYLDTLTSNAGMIHPKTDVPAVFINNSSYPVSVSVDMYMSDVSSSATLSGPIVVSTPGAIDPTTTNVSLLMYVVPSANDVRDFSSTYMTSYPFVNALNGYSIPIDDKSTSDAEALSLKFNLEQARYKVYRDSQNAARYYLQREPEDLGHGSAITIRGNMNPNANWSEFADKYVTSGSTASGAPIYQDTSPAAVKLSLNVIFQFEKDTTEYPASAFDMAYTSAGTFITTGAAFALLSGANLTKAGAQYLKEERILVPTPTPTPSPSPVPVPKVAGFTLAPLSGATLVGSVITIPDKNSDVSFTFEAGDDVTTAALLSTYCWGTYGANPESLIDVKVNGVLNAYVIFNGNTVTVKSSYLVDGKACVDKGGLILEFKDNLNRTYRITIKTP